ncbi:putative Ig domain-containing protein [Ideonella sp. 4Y16]|uniref:Ig domain-containing protein n=1 Tax=Ideonella alba TaxID=2824118 RepID=A0A940Y4J5_9BURK|nr:Ig domain-containing protein [Ideonella alba]MBQ0930099.1 putative Ig domain-containing protein [Ideonella alba]MBQ0943164.1 putative Ig domain-containing protein [Ideonella alba]
MIVSRCAAFALASAACVLTACGGGGGGGSNVDDLVLSFSYTPSVANLWGTVSDAPNIGGLQGHTPTCAVSAGRLPQGVNLNSSTCVISGSPTETGNFDATIRLTVSGYSGFVETSYGFGVVGMSPVYQWEVDANRARWAYSFSDRPTIDRYSPRPGDTVTYELLGGLPAGLSMDTTTGVVQGVPEASGSFQPQIRITITRDGRTYQSTAARQPLKVEAPVLDIAYEPTTLVAGTSYDIGLLQANSLLGSDYTDYSFRLHAQPGCPAAVPAGWAFDTATGRISGTATAGLNQCVGSQLVVRHNGLVKTYDLTLLLKV